jgi:hypothetical protein
MGIAFQDMDEASFVHLKNFVTLRTKAEIDNGD